MANELRSLRVPSPPYTVDAAASQWMRDVTNTINALPFSIFSTANGPNVSLVTAPQGFFGLEIGSSATKHWVKTSGSTSTGWSPLSITTTPTLSSGTWLPTLSWAGPGNISAASAYVGQWMRVGNTVTASGYVDVDPMTTATATALQISPPVASSFAAVAHAAGTAFASAIAGQGAAIRALAGSGNVEMVWMAGDVSNQPMHYTFTYLVI